MHPEGCADKKNADKLADTDLKPQGLAIAIIGNADKLADTDLKPWVWPSQIIGNADKLADTDLKLLVSGKL